MNRLKFSLLIISLLLTGTLWAQSNAPTGLTVNVTYGGSICLQWKPNITAATAYEVERSDDGRNGWTKVGESAAVAGGALAVGNYCDQNLPSLKTYFYQVRGITGRTFTLYSNSISGITKAAPPTPVAPTFRIASASSIVVTWTTQLSTTYELELQQGTNWLVVSTQNSGRNNSLSAPVNSLGPGQQYCFRVRAKDPQEGTSNYSPTACQSLPNAASNIKNFVVKAQNSSSIKLNWTPYGKESGIVIEISEDGGRTWSKRKDWLADSGEFLDTGLQPGKQYCYRILESGHDPSEFKCDNTQPVPLGTPQNFGATAQSASDIKLTWTAVSGASSYELDRSSDGNDPWTRVTNPSGSATEATDGSRAANTRYYYRLRAIGPTGAPGPYATANEITKSLVVSPPGTLTATAVGSSQIDLTWQQSGSTFASGYIIELKENGNFRQLDVVNGVATTSYPHKNLTPNTQYCYRIRTNGTPPSGPGNEACATTQAPAPTAPRPPSNLKIDPVSDKQLTLTWDDNSNNEDSFEIWWATSQTATFTQLTTVPADRRTYDHTGLPASTNYCYQVRAVNGVGKSTFAGPVCTSTKATPITGPNAPTGFKATAKSTTEITLTWTDASTNETGFEIQWSRTSSGPWTSLPTQASNVATYMHTGLTPNTPYYYQLRAVNSADKSVWVTDNTTTPALPVPSTTADLKAELLDYDQARLSWGAITNNPTGIVVERSDSQAGPFNQVGSVLPGTATTFTDVGLSENRTYYYRIRATNANGPSGNSNVAPITTPEAIISVRPMPLPEGIYAHIDNQTLLVTLNWNQFAEAQLTVTSLTGRTMLTDTCRINGGTRFQYGVAQLPAGIYLLSLDTATNRYTKKLCIR